MIWNAAATGKTERIRLYFFLSAFALNIFLGVTIVANRLSIRYFLYAIPMTIQISLLSPFWSELLWIGSLYVVHITKESVADLPKFRHVQGFLNMALAGSFLLVFSIFLDLGNTLTSMIFFLDHLFLIALLLMFAGSILALFTILYESKDIRTLFLLYLSSLLIPIEIWSLIHWLVYPFDIILYSEFAWKGAFTELQLFYLSYPLILWLTVMLLFSWIWVPLTRFARSRIGEKLRMDIKRLFFHSNSKEPSHQAVSEAVPNCRVCDNRNPVVELPTAIAILSISLGLGILVAYYPYLSSSPWFVGNDTYGYYVALMEMSGRDFFGAMQFIVAQDKPLYFLWLYALWNSFKLSPDVLIKILPIITIVANALAVFWFMKTGEKSALVAAMGAVFSIFSFATTISMHAGTLANWLAIALGSIIFGLVLKLQEKLNFKLLFMAILTSAAVFLIHYWSGLFFMLVLGCYAFLTLWDKGVLSARFAAAVSLVATAVFATFLVSGLASQLLGPYAVSYSFDGMGPTAILAAFWDRLSTFIDTWFSGALANPVMVGLALIGIVLCFQQRTNFSRLLISWIITGSLLSVLVSPIGENMNQWLLWRTLYLIPLQIPASIGTCFLIAKLGGLRQTENHVQQSQSDVHPSKSSGGPLDRRGFIVIFALLVGYVLTAFLLTIDFPAVPTVLLFSYPAITLIVHFRIRKRPDRGVIVFMFAILVTLILFNYTLRTLAPLSALRLQPQ